MNTKIFMLLLPAVLLACSSLDFFQYRENTGLYVVEKPEGYETVKFGTRIAASGDDTKDYMAVSAGAGSSTLFYDLARDGQLVDISDYKLDLPGGTSDFNSGEAYTQGSGADLAGLPLFALKGKPVSGCMAVGQANANKITVWCASEDETDTLTGDTAISNFGQSLASIRMGDGAQFLLVGGGRNAFQVFADIKGDATTHSNMVALSDSGRTIAGLAGGRMAAEAGAQPLVFVAVDSMNTNPDGGDHRMVLFLQQEGSPMQFSKVACLENTDAGGFGGALATGDLDGDGADELVVGAAPGQDVYDSRVRIYDVAAMIDAVDDPSVCVDIADQDVPNLVTIKPTSEAYDVECTDECGFGSALAVGDVAVDDAGPELIIGAPRAEVEGVSKAGAVYIYRGWQRTTSDDGDTFEAVVMASQVFDSTPEGGKEFGAAVSVAPMAGRNELLVSATGEGKVFIAFCTGVGEDITEGADTTKDATGKTISTRCRL